MRDRIDALRRELEAETIDSEEAAERFRIAYLGRKRGKITALFKQIGEVPPAERPAFGQAVNALKAEAEARLEQARSRLQEERIAGTAPLSLKAGQAQAKPDLTLPGRRPPIGSVHPLTQTLEEITRTFERFGFSAQEGPEIEDDWHNFTALGFPPDHPARDMQDTFFLRKNRGGNASQQDVVLRTHTSPVQIRVMEVGAPPFRVIVPGRVYRNEAISYKSFCLFHQVEGLYVDEHVSMADLKGTLTRFARALFGRNVRMRFRPSFFPFTEPSAELDIWWADEKESGSLPRTRSGGGRWMEILGCGMVDPVVFEAVGIDAERYTGYAFGMGVERIAMLRHGIDDIRVFYENDVRFLEQF